VAVAVIEVTTFQLAQGAEEERFLAADRRVQAAFAYQQPGLVRRTTARAAGGDQGWVVIEVWESAVAADRAAARRADDPATAALLALVDSASAVLRRFADLD
jgi:hypothetical protein